MFVNISKNVCRTIEVIFNVFPFELKLNFKYVYKGEKMERNRARRMANLFSVGAPT